MMNRLALLTLASLAVACAVEPPATELRASGHVEATETRLSMKIGGRLIDLALAEGDRIELGAVVARLDARDFELAVDRARAEAQQAEAQARLIRAGARVEEVRQFQAQAQAARDEVGAIAAELSAASTDLDRFEALLAANAGSRKQRDDAAMRVDVARQRLRAAESRVRAADEATARLQAGARAAEIDAAEARVQVAKALLATAEEALANTILNAPVTGVVTQKIAETGEMVGPGAPLAIVTDVAKTWADVYVPEPLIPRLRLNQPATVFTDAGGQGLTGQVTYISPQAEFTPRNVQTAEERSRLVYRVRVTVDNTAGVLKQGMPIEAVLPLNQGS